MLCFPFTLASGLYIRNFPQMFGDLGLTLRSEALKLIGCCEHWFWLGGKLVNPGKFTAEWSAIFFIEEPLEIILYFLHLVRLNRSLLSCLKGIKTWTASILILGGTRRRPRDLHFITVLIQSKKSAILFGSEIKSPNFLTKKELIIWQYQESRLSDLEPTLVRPLFTFISTGT